MDSEEKLLDSKTECEEKAADVAEESCDELALLREKLEKLEAEKAESEQRFCVMSILNQKSLPMELGEFITADSEDEIMRRADMLEDVISEAVKREVARRMPRSAPTAGSMKRLNRSDILNMSLAELSDYYV